MLGVDGYSLVVYGSLRFKRFLQQDWPFSRNSCATVAPQLRDNMAENEADNAFKKRYVKV